MYLRHFESIAAAGLAEEQIREHPDACLAVAPAEGAVPLAWCSLWWKNAPQLPGERTGCLGHFASSSPTASAALLEAAEARLREAGCTLAVAPMNGNTWRSYRFVTGLRDSRAPFFLEPWNEPAWPEEFRSAGFGALATYSSSLTPLAEDGRDLAKLEERLAQRGVAIRSIDPARFRDELGSLFELSLAAFADNFLYAPIERSEFLELYGGIEALVVPGFVLLAESASGEAIGFVFALPDPGERGTLIVKTLAVHPRFRHLGLGSVLVERVHSAAREREFSAAIHALQHESNSSRKITARSRGRRIREYTLFAKSLEKY